jgi:hypothetical protein
MRVWPGISSLTVAALLAACDADTPATPDASAPDAAPVDATSADAAAGGGVGTGGTPDPGGTPAPGGSFGGLGGSVAGVDRPVGACALACSCSTWLVAPPYPPNPEPLFETACAGEGGTPVSACPDAALYGVCERAVELFIVRRAYPRDAAQCPASTEDLRAACEAEGGAWE